VKAGRPFALEDAVLVAIAAPGEIPDASLNYLIGAREQRYRRIQAERGGSP
jgi:hypothetical protein